MKAYKKSITYLLTNKKVDKRLYCLFSFIWKTTRENTKNAKNLLYTYSNIESITKLYKQRHDETIAKQQYMRNEKGKGITGVYLNEMKGNLL